MKTYPIDPTRPTHLLDLITAYTQAVTDDFRSEIAAAIQNEHGLNIESLSLADMQKLTAAAECLYIGNSYIPNLT